MFVLFWLSYFEGLLFVDSCRFGYCLVCCFWIFVFLVILFSLFVDWLFIVCFACVLAFVDFGVVWGDFVGCTLALVVWFLIMVVFTLACLEFVFALFTD